MTWLNIQHPVALFLAFAIFIGAIAFAAPEPNYPTDRGTYLLTGQQIIVRDCSDIHCFRVLLAWVLEALPGPSLVKWKTHAVLANAGAAIALGRLCLLLGFSAYGSTLAAWIAAFGFGSLYTVYDSYTSDPLIFLLGPLLMAMLIRGQRGRAGVISAVGVFAKEFAAAPLWIAMAWAALRRRWEEAMRLLLVAMAVTLIWLMLQMTLMTAFDYTYADNSSADLLHGGYITFWLNRVPLRVVIEAMLAEFGALYLLFPVGLLFANRDLRLLALAATPAVLALVYVQQPDRALWNFHFVVIPVCVLVLEQLPGWLAALFVASFAASNLRIGAQLTFAPAARGPLVISLFIAVIAIGAAFFNRGPRPEVAVEASV